MTTLLFQAKQQGPRLPTDDFEQVLHTFHSKKVRSNGSNSQKTGKRKTRKAEEVPEELPLVKSLLINFGLEKLSGKNNRIHQNRVTRVHYKPNKVVSAINKSVVRNVKKVLAKFMIANTSAGRVVCQQEDLMEFLKQNYTNGLERICEVGEVDG